MSGGRTITVDDATALDGPEIDVAARVAWVLRMARTTSASGIQLRALADELGTSAARLSRMETGQLRDGRVVDGYESALGLVEGSLRAPIDILCRTFPQVSPRDADPGSRIETVRELSQLTERLQGAVPVTGGEWLRWARATASPGNIGLPERQGHELLARLVSELARSVSHGYPSRYEALSLVRCSAYGHLVLSVTQEEVARTHAQGLGDLMSAVGEAVTDDALDWCLALLVDEREYVARCGALAIENMGQISGTSFWEGVAPRLLDALEATEPGSSQEEWVTHLIRLVPRDVWRSNGLVPARPLPPAAPVPTMSRDESNALWRECVAAARAVGDETGVGEQPMLARLLYDICLRPLGDAGRHGLHAAQRAVPVLAGPPAQRVAALVEATEDPRIRARGARRLARACSTATTSRWCRGGSPIPTPACGARRWRVAGAAGTGRPGRRPPRRSCATRRRGAWPSTPPG